MMISEEQDKWRDKEELKGAPLMVSWMHSDA